MPELATPETTETSLYGRNSTVQQHKAYTRKCWICLTVVELEVSELSVLRDLFLAKSLYSSQAVTKETQNFVQLRLLFNKIILSACKCRRKLAHQSCFNAYIDIRQNGNINIPCLNVSSSLTAVCLWILAVYWCSLSYGVLTVLQIYGNEEGTALIRSTNVLASVTLLPLIPAALVLSRFLPWQRTLQRLFPVCFKIKSSLDRDKDQLIDSEQQQVSSEEDDDDDEDESQDRTRFDSHIRLVIGGLALPTIAFCIERIVCSMMGDSNYQPSIIGLAFVGVKGVSKIFYRQKKLWEEANKAIQNYKKV